MTFRGDGKPNERTGTHLPLREIVGRAIRQVYLGPGAWDFETCADAAIAAVREHDAKTKQSEDAPEELQAVEIGPNGKAYIIGVPGTKHDCDQMACPSVL